MEIAYPLLTITDDSGAIVTGATVELESVVDVDGVAIPSHGAAVHVAGPNVSVTYDAEAKGEAWVTIGISKVGSVFSGLNATPSFFLSEDSSRVIGNLDASVSSRLALSSYTAAPAEAAIASALAPSFSAISELVALPVVVQTNNDKAGYSLGATGLDAIPTTLSGAPNTWKWWQWLLFAGLRLGRARKVKATGVVSVYDASQSAPIYALSTTDVSSEQTVGPPA